MSEERGQTGEGSLRATAVEPQPQTHKLKSETVSLRKDKALHSLDSGGLLEQLTTKAGAHLRVLEAVYPLEGNGTVSIRSRVVMPQERPREEWLNPSQTFSSSLHSMFQVAKESSLYTVSFGENEAASVPQKRTDGQFRNGKVETT